MILELFKQITAIPRCSGTHQPFIDFVSDFASRYGYEVSIDSAHNIVCFQNNTPSIMALQSHYDIVCLKDNTIPEIVEGDHKLKAKNSTLGADNGIGCAYMLSLMTQKIPCEFLFTSDEEIGLIGANHLDFQLQSPYMLNLDSEEEGRICIGCAGGIDIFCTHTDGTIIQNNGRELYEITIDTKMGGHSGVDIDKKIPNAIFLVALAIKNCNGELLDINGGERINSIPRKCTAIIATQQTPIVTHQAMKIAKIATTSEHYKSYSHTIIDFLVSFSNPIKAYDTDLNIPKTSINLSLISTNHNGIIVSLSGRSMENGALELLKNETVSQAKQLGFEVNTHGKYPAWQPTINQFSKTVQSIYQKHFPNASFEAVHAGLECAIFKEKFPNMLITTIGPNIHYPHSHQEECEIESVYRVYGVLEDIIATLRHTNQL